MPAVAIVTEPLVKFARRMALSKGYPGIAIAVTQDPVHGLEEDVLSARAQALLPAVIEGLTLPVTEQAQRLMSTLDEQLNPSGIVRSSGAA